ncbi:hypothetical protein HanOQP8_Chr17g0657111 [Helianthus annuus]|nr:hypothetical protein HanOQP8_Chr17g0657111 [Helianthus annuus]
MAIAISNLGPGITFLIAVFFRYKHYPLYFKIRKPNAKCSLCFRLEKLDTTISSVAKLLGTMISILGAMVFTLYQGPRMFHINSPNQLFLSQPSEWIYGSLIILISLIFGCIWVVLQIDLFYLKAVYTTTVRCSVFTWCLWKKGPIFVAMFSPLSIVIAMIMGVTFLGDSLHLGSVIGTTIISFGFYTVIWGQTKEKNKLLAVTNEDLDVSGSGSSADESLPLLSSRYQ